MTDPPSSSASFTSPPFVFPTDIPNCGLAADKLERDLADTRPLLRDRSQCSTPSRFVTAISSNPTNHQWTPMGLIVAPTSDR